MCVYVCPCTCVCMCLGQGLTKSVIGTSSSSSTEAWLVHPELDIWLVRSASTTATATLGLVGASSGEKAAASAAPGEKEEEEPGGAAGGEEDKAWGAGDERWEELAAGAAVSPPTS